MKALVQRYAERIDNATLRERALIFFCCAVVMIYAVNAALIDPLRSRQKALAAENEKLRLESQTLQASLQRLVQGGSGDIDAANRARQAAAREELSRLNAQVAQEQRRFTPPERMRTVLAEMFQGNKRLSLVDLKTLPLVPLAGSPPGPGGEPGMFRHGIELTVSGTYLDLHEYLRMLERLPTQVYWGRAELAAGEYPSCTLKLTLYTVSFDRAWLIV